MKYKVAVAGSSEYTVMAAEALQTDQRFEIVSTISPTPKIIGHNKFASNNPLHNWSLKQGVNALLVEKKIETSLEKELQKSGYIDFLLVVDFGYLIPKWLLALPKIAPLNIHPSLLPKWRGSSPGQFALLFQDLDPDGHNSAVTLMVMDESLDSGPIISQLPIEIKADWTQNEYYQAAFELITKNLANLINGFAQNKIKSKAQAQKSPTMLARRLNKTDGFINWNDLSQLMSLVEAKITRAKTDEYSSHQLLSSLLFNKALCQTKLDQVKLVVNASKALSTWPGVWTLVQTNQGQKRMKILSCLQTENQLKLEKVQIEGKNSCLFNECKNSIL